MGNTLEVLESDSMYLHLPVPATAPATSGDWYVYGIESDNPTRYIPMIGEITTEQEGAGSHVREKLPAENVALVQLKSDYDGDANPAETPPDKVIIHKDGQVYWNANFADSVTMTNLAGRIEDASLSPFLICDLNPTRRIDETLSDDVEVHVLGGTDEVEVYLTWFALQFDPERTGISESRLVTDIRSKINRKRGLTPSTVAPTSVVSADMGRPRRRSPRARRRSRRTT
jgi:hypothetical protein